MKPGSAYAGSTYKKKECKQMADWVTRLQEASLVQRRSDSTPAGLRPQSADSPAAKLDKVERILSSTPTPRK